MTDNSIPTTFWPPLNPLFKRLAELHPWWSYSFGPVYDGVTEWAHDGGTFRDMDWMRTHLRLLRAVRNTVAGLSGFGYKHQGEFTDTGGSKERNPVQERWAVVYRGETIRRWREPLPYDPEESQNPGDEEDEFEEEFVKFGEARSSGPTDLHAMLGALVLALEAHAAEGRTLEIDETWRTYELREART